jgi:hypothetical protein
MVSVVGAALALALALAVGDAPQSAEDTPQPRAAGAASSMLRMPKALPIEHLLAFVGTCERIFSVKKQQV